MKIGLQVYYFGWPGAPGNIGDKLMEIGKTAESAGFSSLWAMDHLFQLEGGFGPPEVTHIEAPMLEGYCTISYLAAVTQRIKIGLMVTNNLFRYPGILIKTITTLDVLSGGRAYFGIGSGGGMQREAKGLGLPLPQTRGEIVERLEETLQIARKMWKGDHSPYEGKYCRLAEPMNFPSPLSQPHPPILIGMWSGGKKMLRLVATYADACNFQIGTSMKEFPPYIRERNRNYRKYLACKLRILRDICEEVGRSYDEIERTALATIKLAPDAMSTTEIVDLCRDLARLGINQVIFNMPNVHEIKTLEIMGNEVMPMVTEFEEGD
ncbi:MAG: LLM class flavin-dependent oxidoreductase [Candidatus Thorarchaeota archaeon]